MPLTPEDLVALPYTPDMTQAGLVYAERFLAHGCNPEQGRISDQMRRVVAAKAADLAFRRYLGGQGIAYGTFHNTPYTEPDRSDVVIAGRKCDVKSMLIYQREKIHAVRLRPEQLLEARALVPLDQPDSTAFSEEDIYIFAFVTGLIARRPEQPQVAAAGQPLHLIHPLPAPWSRSAAWMSLGALGVKAETDVPVTLSLGGSGAHHTYQSESVLVDPHQKVNISQDFYSLAFLQVSQIMGGRVGISSARLEKTYLIQPSQWSNIWVYGMDVYLAGYIKRGEYRRQADLLQAGSRVNPYLNTQGKHLSLPVANLSPISDLVWRVKDWERNRR